MTSAVSHEHLRQFIERIETLEEEKAEVAREIKDVFAEAKGTGFDVKAMRAVLKLRKRHADDVAEEAAIIELYAQAIGMDVTVPTMPEPLRRDAA